MLNLMINQKQNIQYTFFYMENSQSRDSSKPRQVEARGIKMKRKPMFDESGTTLLNGVKLSFEKGFGFHQNPDLRNTAYCIDDNRIIYLLSSQIALYDMLAQTQRLIDSFDSEDDVGALTYFKNIMLEDNIVYSIHNPNKSFATLTIMNFSKNFSQKLEMDNLYKEQKITDIVLFNDYRNIAIISRLDKAVRLTIVQVAVNRQIKAFQYLNFNPIGMLPLIQHPTKLVFFTTTDIIYTDIEDELKMVALSLKKWFQFQNQEKIVQIANSLHTELSIYAITDQANLYFVTIDPKENKITKVTKHFLGNYQTLDEKGVEVTKRRKPSSICANQYNIAIGYESIQELTLVKISAVASQAPTFEAIKFCCPFLHKIARMSFAAETMAICIIVQVKQNDKYEFSIPIQSQFLKQKGDDKIVKQSLRNHLLPPGKVFPIVFNLLLYDTLVETLKSPVQAVLNSMLLTKKILDICVLPTKKLILVLSADKRIKAIKYEHVSSISFDKMLAWQMIFNINDRPTSLDVHPLTFIVAVGSKLGVKLFNIYPDGMKTTNLQFNLTNCQCVRYSRFGHLLVAGSSDLILLINPYENSVQRKIELSHGYGYGVKQLSFVDRDMYIFSNFVNGSSQVLKLDGSKVFEIWNKGAKCIHSCYDPVFDIMIVSYEDNEVKFYRQRGEIEFAILWTYPFLVTKILLVNQLGTAFMGTSTGKIRAYQWPFTDMTKFNKSFTEIQLHKSPISQIKITHDFSFLITGAQDGTIFISKITPYSDGMIVSDSSILHTFKVNKKNYTSLYYLQDYMCTNNSNESERQQQIMRYQSDKSDSASQFVYILQNLQMTSQQKYQKLEQKNKKKLKQQIDPLQNQIEQINHRKLDVKEQISVFLGKWQREVQQMQGKKLDTMRSLYKQSDHLRLKVQFYTKQFKEQLEEAKKNYAAELQSYKQQKQHEEFKLIEQCNELQKDFSESLINNKEALKQQDEQGKIYKSKMMEQLETQLKIERDEGEKLRKTYNKNNHSIKLEEEKLKYLQQLSSEMEMDIANARVRKENLGKQIVDLGEMLKQKDKQILNEEKAVKELLKKSINNYSHEQFLKHKQDELIQKARYLQKQITELDDKYKVFQQNFVQMSKQTNSFTSQIETAYITISQLKQKQKQTRQKHFMKRYKDKQTYNKIMQTFHECCSKTVFGERVKKILNIQDTQLNQQVEQKIDVFVGKRDHLIDQVVNTNKLRKIDDKIKKTLMYKLNRETVSLTSQVNQLRKEKKMLTVKIRDLHECIREVQGLDKQNIKDISSLTDIVPMKISIIRSQASKHNKPLPFQVYQHNKLQSQSSSHSKMNSKSIVEQGSTQLPSILKHSQSYAGSILEQSTLFGVEENDDEIAQ